MNNIFPPKPRFGDGITNVVHNISKELAKRGHEVIIYTSNALDLYTGRKITESEYRTPDNVRVHYTDYIWSYGPFLFTPSIVPLLRRTLNQFDVIHIHDAKSFQGIVAYLIAAQKKAPYVFQPHGSLSSLLPHSFTRRAARLLLERTISNRLVKASSQIIALNGFEAKHCTMKLGIPEEKITIIPNGISSKGFVNLPAKGQFRKKYNLPEGKKIILYLGRIHRIKGVDLLIRAYAYLTRTLGFRDAVLVIAGPDDGFLDTSRNLANYLELGNSIYFTGPLYGKDKLEGYADTDVFVLPSRYETFPNSLLEALACGKPVVCSRLPGLEEIVDQGVTGLLVEMGDVRELAISIRSILTNSLMAKEIGLKGKALVQKRFSLKSVVNKLEKVYAGIPCFH